MGPAITDYVRFLADARDAVYRLNCDQNTAAQLADEEEHQEQELETANRAVADAVNQTVKKRLDEINSSYDKEIAKGQERLKRPGQNGRRLRIRARSFWNKVFICSFSSRLCSRSSLVSSAIRSFIPLFLAFSRFARAFLSRSWPFAISLS